MPYRDSSNKIVFANEELENILDLYLKQKKSVNFISSFYKVNFSVILRVLKENKIEIRNSNFYKAKKVDSFFFNEINTEEKAYILGFIYADGCISNNVLSIKQKTDDVDILEKIKFCLKSEHKIINYIENSGYSKNCNVSMLSFKDLQIIKDLYKYGVIENKSKILKFPLNIPECLVSHFIRGYFDGDGSVYKIKQNNSIGISFVGTNDMLSNILLKFQQICDTNTHIYQYKDKDIFGLTIGGKNNIEKIYYYLYNDATIFLNRKEEVFKKYFKNA